MKKILIPVLMTMLLGGLALYASARSLTIKGEVRDVTALDRGTSGVAGVVIKGSLLNDHGAVTDTFTTTTDEKGRYSITMDSGDATFAIFKKFEIVLPSTPAGYRALYASNNNIASFWETTYLNQVAGLSCRSERVFCSKDEAWRDKSSNSGYNFAVEPAPVCKTRTGNIISVPNDDGKMTGRPSVAFDGSTVVLAGRGVDGSLWLATARSIADGRWNEWTNVTGVTIAGDSYPVIRVLDRNKFAIFIKGIDGKFYSFLRDSRASRTPFIDVTPVFSHDFSQWRNIVATRDGVFEFVRIQDPTNGVSYQLCSS